MDNQRGNIEVSLPGAGESEPTILEVINRNTITNSETETPIETVTDTTSPQSQPLENRNQETEKDLLNIESKTLTTEELHKVAKDTLGNINLNIYNNDSKNTESKNILDIESHLIETFENFSVSEESDNSGVAIRECQPAKEELKRSSQIETETSPKTIIEIEPSIPKILKPIELELDLNINKQFGIKTTEINNDTIPNNLKEQNLEFIANEQANDINNITSHIEEKIDECIISEKQPQNLNQKDSIKENITIINPINSDIGIGINGLQNCITPLEEEEKKKLLDSLPQLDENDSNSLSIQAKKEYYQSLREYLDKHQDDRPPVPIQTYRWEDLRRAKEKGGYPWTHLYKRPLGPEEEPEIVLLLRKSQEFRFSSESPRSLKKVRIHDQVLIKETERYINDLSDTEDNPDGITEVIKNTEDNHSIHSETANSLPSESVPKKSKLSKLKGILKRHSSTNETKLSSPDKSVIQETSTTIDGDDNVSLNSASAISGVSDTVPEDKKSKLKKLKGLVKRQSGEAKNKKSKESASIFYSDSLDEATTEANQSLHTELEAKKSEFDQFIDTVKGGKNIDGEQLDKKENLINPAKKNSSLSETQTEDDKHSVYSESAIIGLSGTETKTSKLSKLKGFLKIQSGDKKPDDTKSVQSESALEGKPSKLKKLQRVFKIRKDIDKKEKQSKIAETSEISPTTEFTQRESALSEYVPESQKIKPSKFQELIKIKSDTKKADIAQEDTKSVQNESGISSKSESTLERKKFKLSNLKQIFKGGEEDNKKPEELEQTTTDLDEPTSPDSHTVEAQSIQTETETNTSIPKTKVTKLNKLKGIAKSAAKNPTSEEVISSSLIDDNSTDKKAEIDQEDTKSVQSESGISSKSESTLERKKFKFSNLKKIFKGGEENKKKPEELEKTTTDLDEPASPDSHTVETQSIQTETESSTSIPKTKVTKLKKLKGIVKSAAKNPTSEEVASSSLIDDNSTDKKAEIDQEDTKSVQSESGISSKSESTLERKKFKFSNLKQIFKGGEENKKKPEELEKTTTDLDEPASPDSHTVETQSIQTETESSTSIPKTKVTKLKKLKGIVKSAAKNPTSEEVASSSLIDDNSTDKKAEIDQEDTKSVQSESGVSSKSESTLERKKFKLSNLKQIFKGQKDNKSEKTLDEPISPDSHTDETQSIQSETQSSKSVPKSKATKLKKLKGIVKQKNTAKKPRSKKVIVSSTVAKNSTEVINTKSEDSPEKEKCCQPIMDKLKNLTDKQFKKRNIKKVPLKDEEKIILEEEQKILKLRESPKSVRGEIPKFVEKQDSEDLLEIVQLEESPSQKRKEQTSSILIPDEIIEIPSNTLKIQERQQNVDPSITPEPTISEILEAELKSTPPVKTLRKMKAHIYEDIENNEPTIEMKIDEILQLASVEALKKSLAAQDQTVLKDMESNKQIPLDRMGSSEEEIEKAITSNGINHLAPISSIDSASSDEQERRTQLSPVAEESDVCSTDGKDIIVIDENRELDVKSALKRESSPSPSIGDKKVTFSHIEDDAEPHREDIEVPEELKGMPNRWSTMK